MQKREKREKLAKNRGLELFPSWQGIDGASERGKKVKKKKMSHFSFALKIVQGGLLSLSSIRICGTYVCEKKMIWHSKNDGHSVPKRRLGKFIQIMVELQYYIILNQKVG